MNFLRVRSLPGGKLVLPPDRPRRNHFTGRGLVRPHRLVLFPAFVIEPQVIVENPAEDPEAARCYNHTEYPATSVCAKSGRLICPLCATTWNGETWSLQALYDELGPRHHSPWRTRLRYENLAVLVALAGWPLQGLLGLLSGPASLLLLGFWVRECWRRRKARRWGVAVLAFALACMEIATGVIFWRNLWEN